MNTFFSVFLTAQVKLSEFSSAYLLNWLYVRIMGGISDDTKMSKMESLLSSAAENKFIFCVQLL